MSSTTKTSFVPIFSSPTPLAAAIKKPQAIKTNEIILIVVAVLVAIVFGIVLIVVSYHFSKRKELFIISFNDPADYIVPSTTKTIAEQVKPFIDDIKTQLDIEGLASFSELKEASVSSASWCERGMIDTDFVHVYYIYNKNTSSSTSDKCVNRDVPNDGNYFKESISSSDGVEGFLVYAEKPKNGTKYTFAGKSFVVKVPWNGKKWSRYS